MIQTGNPALDRAAQALDQAGRNWDKAYRQLNDNPNLANMRIFNAADQAYTQTQRTYILAVTVSQLAPAAVAPIEYKEHTDANTGL